MPGAAQRAWRDAVARSRDERPDDVWIDEGPVDGESRPAPDRSGKGAPRRKAGSRSGPAPRAKRLPADVVDEMAGAVPPTKAPKLQARLGEAVRAYERDRYQDALAILRPLADQAPDASSVRELLGLTYYRMGRWKQALKELDAFRQLTHSYDQHPTVADCNRALGRFDEVDDLYRELAEASPSAELVAEGRIVAAGALADQGRLADAIRLLEAGKLSVRKPREHHLRMWFALADLYERAGDLPKARRLFERVAAADPDLYDVGQRLAALG